MSQEEYVIFKLFDMVRGLIVSRGAEFRKIVGIIRKKYLKSFFISFILW